MRMLRLLTLLVFFSACNRDDFTAVQHKQQALEFAKHIDPNKTWDVTCMAEDMDLNGYLTCTLFPGGGGMPISVECSTYKSNPGCKVAAVKAVQGN